MLKAHILKHCTIIQLQQCFPSIVLSPSFLQLLVILLLQLLLHLPWPSPLTYLSVCHCRFVIAPDRAGFGFIFPQHHCSLFVRWHWLNSFTSNCFIHIHIQTHTHTQSVTNGSWLCYICTNLFASAFWALDLGKPFSCIDIKLSNFREHGWTFSMALTTKF